MSYTHFTIEEPVVYGNFTKKVLVTEKMQNCLVEM